MTNPTSNPNSMSIVMTTAVSEETSNTTIVPTSQSDVGTTSETLTMCMTTDLTVTQETDSTYKSFAIEKELSCPHVPNPIFMTDWKRLKSSHIWEKVVLSIVRS